MYTTMFCVSRAIPATDPLKNVRMFQQLGAFRIAHVPYIKISLTWYRGVLPNFYTCSCFQLCIKFLMRITCQRNPIKNYSFGQKASEQCQNLNIYRTWTISKTLLCQLTKLSSELEFLGFQLIIFTQALFNDVYNGFSGSNFLYS